MNDQLLLKLLRQYDSFYLYDESVILPAARRLQAAFPGVALLYSIKCNPCNAVVDTLVRLGFGADAASPGEAALAEARGIPAGSIYFSAPGQTEQALRSTYGRCVQIADSLGAIESIAAITSERGETAKIGVRINPDFTFTDGQGVPSKFGIDESALWAAAPRLAELPVQIAGIHVHIKSQELSSDILARYYENIFRLAGRVQERLGVTLEFANLGSGLGIPFAPNDLPLNAERLGAHFQSLLDTFRQTFPAMRILIETGRYVIGPAGSYVTKVVDKKVSHGETFVILHGTLNNFLRPAIAEMMRPFSPAPCEPLFTCGDSTRLRALTAGKSGETETVTLAGSLCTAADIIARNVELPRLEIGDGVVLEPAGCYGAALSPMQFASMPPPAQLFLAEDGQVREAC